MMHKATSFDDIGSLELIHMVVDCYTIIRYIPNAQILNFFHEFI